MRFMLCLLLAACSDYDLVKRPDEGISNAPTTNAAPQPSEDEDLDGDGCWFPAWEYYNDYEIGVKTLPVYRLVSPSEITINPGDDVTLKFSISSYNKCGDIKFHYLLFYVQDLAEASYEWMKRVNDAAIDSYFEDISGESTFDPYAARNMYVTPTGDELHYIWHDGTWASTYSHDTNMATEVVEATDEKVYELTWTASSYAPSGSTFTIEVGSVVWTDVATNQTQYTGQGLEGIEVTVHVR